jgi:hypothetical protein
MTLAQFHQESQWFQLLFGAFALSILLTPRTARLNDTVWHVKAVYDH